MNNAVLLLTKIMRSTIDAKELNLPYGGMIMVATPTGAKSIYLEDADSSIENSLRIHLFHSLKRKC